MDLTETTTIRLPAIELAWVDRLRRDPRLLADMTEAVRGPFHVIYPTQFGVNLAAFRNVMATAGVAGTVYFGKKANKSASWPRQCAEAYCGVDVASVPELVHSLAQGVRGKDLVVTGPAKNDELLRLAIRHGSLIAVDALDELDRIIMLAKPRWLARILLRVLPAANPTSRFGLTEAESEHALARCISESHNTRLEGFSFHLSGYDVAPRVWQASELIDRCIAARDMGLPAEAVSIGGGFAVNYLSEASWLEFNREYRDSWFHAQRTFREFYPYHQEPVGADMLAAVLSGSVTSAHVDLADKLAKTGTRLLIEPGRSLLDGCGFTVFPVLGFKNRSGYGIVTVARLSMSLSEQWFVSEYLPDPILWPDTGTSEPTSACVGGSSCLEVDMLTWRKIRFDRVPQVGDLLIYPNTAGYQMDSNESEFHQLPLPPKIVISADQDGLRWLPEPGHLPREG
ncbi:MAG: Y4yA family PLP-dependent enzyme [Pseudonocardiaceae bacterium]